MDDFDKYTMKMELPGKSDFTTWYVYRNGVMLAKGKTVADCVTELNNLKWDDIKILPSTIKSKLDLEGLGFTVGREVNEEQYKAARIKFYDEQNRLHDLFRKDLFEEFGVEDNPKSNYAFGIAWDRGHSSGLHEVYQHFAELAPLLQ